MSGEIQLLIDSIKNVYGNEICNWAVSGCKFDNNEEENIKELLNKISDMCGDESLDKVLKIRGRQCISLDLLGKVKVLQEKSNDVYDFIENLNKEGIPGGEIKIKDNKIIITYPECLCEHAKKMKLLNVDYCNSTVGYLEKLFEYMFQHEMKVEIIQTALREGENCTFNISLINN